MEVVCTDVTFIPMRDGKYCYLSLVIDGHSNKVLGHSVGMNNDADLVLASLSSSLSKYGVMKIIHSDNGVQYLSAKVVEFCYTNGSIQSFSRPGISLDNRPELLQQKWTITNVGTNEKTVHGSRKARLYKALP